MKIDAHQHYCEPRRADYDWMAPNDPVLAHRYTPADLAPILARHDIFRTILVQAAASVEGGLTEPAPAIVLLELGDSAVNWSVRVWATKDTFGDVKQATIRAVKNHLDAAGIGIPYPQMDIHVDRTDAV